MQRVSSFLIGCILYGWDKNAYNTPTFHSGDRKKRDSFWSFCPSSKLRFHLNICISLRPLTQRFERFTEKCRPLKKNGVFFLGISSLVPEILKFCSKNDDVTNRLRTKPNHKINNISRIFE